MDTKYIAIVYDADMNDALRKANVLATFNGMYCNAEGRYSEMDFYELGFDYPTWKVLRDTKYDIEYIDDLGNVYSLTQGRCNNLNKVVKVKDVIQEELDRSEAIKAQIAYRDKYLASNGSDKGICEFVEKKTNVVPNKKAMSLIAYDKDSDLVMPFREIISGSGSLPIFIYIHDKKSRGANNTTLLLKECKTIIGALKASGKDYIMIIPNVVSEYGKVVYEDGKSKMVANGLNRLLGDIIDYEVKEHDADPKRIYIMGSGSGVGDVLSELTLNSDRYAGAVLAFGMGYYKYVDDFKDIVFEVASASDDPEYSDEDISNFVEEIKEIGASVNYSDYDGKPDKAAKEFFKTPAFLNSIFDAVKSNSVNREEPKSEEVKEEVVAE